MIYNLKKMILDLAKNAVLVAETELGSGKGQEKKKMAVDYIVNHLPFSGISKNIIALFLSRFIDCAVEVSVKYMDSLPQEKGE